MAGAATVVCLQQLKGILGLTHFTHATDLVSVLRSVFSQVDQWRWESGVLGCCFLFFLLVTRYFSKKKPKFFWISAMAPLTSVILGSLLVFLTHAEKHGVEVIGELKKGLNPVSITDLVMVSPHLSIAIKTGIITGVIALAEMVAIGTMNMVGSCFSCYLTTGPFSRSAVNFNAGCKTAVSNVVMAIAVMLTLLFLTPLFHYTPLVVLSSIIISAMLGLIDYDAAIHLWKVDKFDFLVCIGAYAGVVFASVEIGLVIACPTTTHYYSLLATFVMTIDNIGDYLLQVAISLLRLLLFVARPRTLVLGNLPNSTVYRNVEQYPNAGNVPGILILEIDAPIYFANSSYLRERIIRWVDEEEDRIKASGDSTLQYVVLDMSAVGNIDTSGISMFEEIKKILDRRGLKKLDKGKFIESLGHEWIYLTVAEAVAACNYMLHSCKPNPETDEKTEAWNSV
ncbi:Sulfate transporter 3.1, partial [Cucurbita argyrosperma subsp. argyrosperma]